MSSITSQKVSLIDALLQEYTFNEKLLTPVKKVAPILSPADGGATTDISNLRLFTPLLDFDHVQAVGKVMALFLERQEVSVAHYRLPILSEFYIQAIANSPPGLHLIVTTRGDIQDVYDRVTNALYEHGFKTAVVALLQDPEQTNDLLEKVLRLIAYSIDARTYLRFTNYPLLSSLLGLLHHFPKEQLSKIFLHDALLKQVNIQKIKIALSQYASRQNCRRPTEEEVLWVCNQAIEMLNQAKDSHRANVTIYNSLTAFIRYIRTESAIDIGFFARTGLKAVIQDLNMRDKSCRTAYQIFYFLVSHFIGLLTKEPEWVIPVSPPNNDQLQSLVNLLPHRSLTFYQDVLNNKTTNKTAVFVTDTIWPLEKIEWDQFLQCPLRSIYVVGRKGLCREEWQKQEIFSQILLEQMQARYPDEPPPFRAFFT